jgi:hypothetical protein
MLQSRGGVDLGPMGKKREEPEVPLCTSVPLGVVRYVTRIAPRG